VKLREEWGKKNYEDTPNVVQNLINDLYQNLGILPQNAIMQIRELCCDWIATMIAGPSYTLAMLTSFGKPETRKIAYSYKNVMSHPPNDIRNFVSSKILEVHGIPVLKILDEIQQEKDASMRETARYLSASVDPNDRGKATYMSEDWKFLKIYRELIWEEFNRVHSQLTSYFSDNNLYKYSNWTAAQKCFENLISNEAVDDSPVQILNAAWFKRNYSSNTFFKRQFDENIVRSFRNFHKFETKLYVPIIESLLRHASKVENDVKENWG
jgi:hypothetical protein